MSKINPLYKYRDVKYFWNLHKQRQHQMGGIPATYNAFHTRLRRGMNLKEAIYRPCRVKMIRYNMKPKRGWSKFKFDLHLLRIRFISFFKH